MVSSGPIRLAGRRMRVTLSIGGQTRTAQVIRRGDLISVRFESGEESLVHAQRTRDGGVTLRPVAQPLTNEIVEAGDHLERGAQHAFLFSSADHRQLWIEGKTIKYRRVETSDAREPSGGGSLAATIPAVVLDVLVSVGEAVTDGQTLILLESMKMVMPIVAPHPGTVSALHCVKGDSVAPGVPLVVIEAETMAS